MYLHSKLDKFDGKINIAFIGCGKFISMFLSQYNQLKKINMTLLTIEDKKRMCEKNSDFGEKFIKLSRDIHFLNDSRSKIKLEINNHTGSKIKEIKEYTTY